MARILVIEDDLDNRELIVCLLKARGHTVLLALNGAEGWEMALEQRPDLILCDLLMPGMSGYAFARLVKDHPSLRHVPLVAVTAHTTLGECADVNAAGFDGLIGKPFEPEAFAERVEGFLVSQPGRAFPASG